MDSASSLLAPMYPNGLTTTVPSILSSSPGTQDSVIGRSGLSGQNGWSNYISGESGPISGHNSCSSMSSYSNLPLGASFSSMNSKSPYNSFTSAGADYINCRQMQLNHMNALNMPSMRNYPLYGDMYQATHPPGYTNGSFYPDMPPGIPPLPGRDIDCRSTNSDSPDHGGMYLIFPRTM